MEITRVPVLTIAGSDSSGGAGIQADLKTMTMLGTFGMSAITAITAQNTIGVQEIFSVPADVLRQQLLSVCTDIPPLAVKIGMVGSAEQVAAIAECIQQFQLSHIVIDPVMLATTGAALVRVETSHALRKLLFPLAELITPNLKEASLLCEMTVQSIPDMEAAAISLFKMYGTAVLVKGGHLQADAVDVLYDGAKLHHFRAARIDNPNTHGTGCTLSSAIAAFLAQECSLVESVRLGKAYVTDCISAGLRLGHGNGPMAHNHNANPYL